MPVTVLARCASGVCTQRLIDLKQSDDDPGSAQLTASVGEKGANRKDDVRLVQTLLNDVDTADGGPSPSLVVDGICGRLTRAAILGFQRRHRELISDGLIERNRNTWKKLISLSGGGAVEIGAKQAQGVAAAPTPISDDTQKLFATYMFLSRHRIFEAIKCLDVATQEVELLNIRTFMRPPVTFMQAYVERFNDPAKFREVQELANADRCFRLLQTTKDIMNMKATAAQVLLTIKKLRIVYATMLDVIAMNSVTTPADEITGKRRFLRVVRQAVLDAAHADLGPRGVIADAVLGGWHNKDARAARIRYGSAYADDSSAFSTLIHELAHFVSSNHTYWIGDHGYYHKAFDASPYLALRNAESYSWYALLSSFKHLRSLPDKSLPTNI